MLSSGRMRTLDEGEVLMSLSRDTWRQPCSLLQRYPRVVVHPWHERSRCTVRQRAPAQHSKAESARPAQAQNTYMATNASAGSTRTKRVTPIAEIWMVRRRYLACAVTLFFKLSTGQSRHKVHTTTKF
jgi:hypothetical protein